MQLQPPLYSTTVPLHFKKWFRSGIVVYHGDLLVHLYYYYYKKNPDLINVQMACYEYYMDVVAKVRSDNRMGHIVACYLLQSPGSPHSPESLFSISLLLDERGSLQSYI